MLRLLEASDIPQLLIIEHLTQQAPWTYETFQHCLNLNYPGWSILAEGKVAGFLIMSLEAGESHILNICVHPLYQRQGYGTQLLIKSLNYAKEKGASFSYLEVRRSNKSAILLYEKHGFDRIGERKDYYPGALRREDALVFAKDLSVE